MKTITLSLFVILLTFNSLVAQNSVVGVVTSAEDGLPLIGVNIIVLETLEGTTSDIDGKFELELADPNSLLRFSYLGYNTIEVSPEGQKVFNVVMEENVAQLEEVVVTALGIQRQKRSIGYSTEDFEGELLALSNEANLVSSLSGRSAGVQVSSANGVDGGTTRVTIRGNNNITSDNQPLIVVDGVQLSNEPGLDDVGGGVDWGSAINNINSEDIETMNILKGPTASALYGSRGANGVILITTKRGRIEKGIGVKYNVTHKIIQPYRFRDVQNIYGAGGPVSLSAPSFQTDADGTLNYPGFNRVHADEGPYGKSTYEQFGFYSTGVSWGPKMEGQMIRWWDGVMRPYDPQPDNLNMYFSNGNTTNHNLSFSGGSEKGTMRVSISRSDHKAIIPNSNYNQNTINLGSNLNISSKVKADLAISYINFNRLNSPNLGDDNDKSFGKGILYSWPRSYKGLERDNNFNVDGTQNDYSNVTGGYPFTYTPEHLWWNTKYNNKELKRNKFLGSLALTYDITSWLNVTGRLGIDFSFDEFEERKRPIDALGIEQGFFGHETIRDKAINSDVLVTAYKDNIFANGFNASLSFGASQWQRRRYGVLLQSGEWVNPWLYSISNFDDPLNAPTIQESQLDKNINSVYSFLNLSYNNYVFLELTGRNDWSSTLPLDDNSYFYPSASVSFVLTEALDLNQDWLSFLKIRTAYAETGTDTDPYKLNFLYETGTFGGVQTASLPSTVPPIALRPQRANSYEVGATLGLLNDRINLDLTYYHINSFDQILDSPLPNSSGANEIRINTGELQNKGIEAILNINLVQKANFFWQTGFNFNRNRNKVIDLGDGAKLLELNEIWDLNGPAIAVREGEDYGTIIGYDYVRHPDSGEPMLNEDGTQYLISDSRVPIGNSSPDFTGGWTMRLGFKGLELQTLVDTKWGGDMYAGSYVIGLQTGQSPETLLEREGGGLPFTDPDGVTSNIGVVLPGVYENGETNNKVVHYYYKYVGNTGGWGRFISTPGIVENTWVNMRQISLAYRFNKPLLEKVRIFEDLRISLVGRNLFYIYATAPDRINPEGFNGSGNAQGLEWAAYPSSRSISLGINATF